MLDFVHLGWPNTAAVLMLAVVPLASLAVPAGSSGRVNPPAQVASATWQADDSQCHALAAPGAMPALAPLRLT